MPFSYIKLPLYIMPRLYTEAGVKKLVRNDFSKNDFFATSEGTKGFIYRMVGHMFLLALRRPGVSTVKQRAFF